MTYVDHKIKYDNNDLYVVQVLITLRIEDQKPIRPVGWIHLVIFRPFSALTQTFTVRNSIKVIITQLINLLRAGTNRDEHVIQAALHSS